MSHIKPHYRQNHDDRKKRDEDHSYWDLIRDSLAAGRLQRPAAIASESYIECNTNITRCAVVTRRYRLVILLIEEIVEIGG